MASPQFFVLRVTTTTVQNLVALAMGSGENGVSIVGVSHLKRSGRRTISWRSHPRAPSALKSNPILSLLPWVCVHVAHQRMSEFKVDVVHLSVHLPPPLVKVMNEPQ